MDWPAKWWLHPTRNGSNQWDFCLVYPSTWSIAARSSTTMHRLLPTCSCSAQGNCRGKCGRGGLFNHTVLLLLLSRMSFHHLTDSSTDLLGSLGSSNWDNGVALRAGQTIICKDPRSTTSVADPVLLLWRDALQLPSPGSVGGVVAAVSRNFGLSTTTDSSRKDSGIAVASEDLECLIVFVRITLRDDDVSGCTKLLGAAVTPLLSGWWGG